MQQIESARALVKQLEKALLKKRILLFVSGLFTTAAVVLFVSIVLSLIALIVVLPVIVKISLLVISAIVTLYFFIKYALRHFVKGDIDSLAVELEKKHPELKGILIAAIQFSRSKISHGSSAVLVEATIAKALVKAEALNFNEALSFYPIIKRGKQFAYTLVAAAALLFLMPGLFTYSYKVYSHVDSVVTPPIGYKLYAPLGSTEWVKYKDIQIEGSIFGGDLPKKAAIYHRMADGDWQKSEIDLRNEKHFFTEIRDSVVFGVTLRQINKSFDYYIEAGRIKTEIYSVDVVDRPRVEAIKLSIFYPEYSKLPPTTIDENNGTFSALYGSRVNLKIESNLPVKTAELMFSDSSRVPITIDNKIGEVSLKVYKSQSYHIRLTDHLGEKNPDPIEYYITAIPDEFPSVDVIRPGFDVNLSDQMMLPLKLHIFDDYGFSSLVMKYSLVHKGQISEQNVAVLHFSEKIKTEGEVEFNWDIDQLNLFPGDYVIYSFEVADNDVISGPKISKSRQYIARLPSLEEIISQTEKSNVKRIDETQKILKTGRDLAKRLENVSRKIKADSKSPDKANWQNQKELESITKKNAEMVKEIEKAAEQMNKAVDDLNDKSLMSREVLEKMAQIQKLYQEIATPEMKKAQQEMMEALKKMDKQKLEKALKDFKMSQEELLKRLERTMALLKKMQLEQKMEAMIRKTEELTRKQEEMNKKTKESEKSQLPKLSKQEKDIQKELKNLKEELKDLQKISEDAKMQNSPELKKFSEALKKTDADKDMQKMQESMDSKKKNNAFDQGKKAHSKLMKMLDEMQKQMMAMKGGDKEKIKKEFSAAIDDTNYLSKKQEELFIEAAGMQTQTLMMRDVAEKQQELLFSCSGLKNRISELAKESPFVASEISKLLEDSFSQMEFAMKQFDDKKRSQGMQDQRRAMTNLNKASLRLMESMEKQKQCNKGGSCNKNTGNMQSLSEKQNKLNKKTQGQCDNPNGQNPKSGKNGREALSRLAAEQSAIRKSVEELAQEFGGSRQILGRLDDIAQEMKKVEESLANGETGPDITQRQLKIFSRMLEASRSLYKKDFSEQRQSKTALSTLMYIPPELSSDILDDNLKLEDRLQKYLGDDYPKQYEEQIKAYFKALLKIEASQKLKSGQ